MSDPMSPPMTCTRLYCDDNGDSHFQDFEIDLNSVQYAPPAPALDISASMPASSAFWFRFPKGWSDDAHPSPRRQLFIVLTGRVEGWTSLGDRRVFGPGDRLLMEDTSGPGHGARPIDGEATALVVALD
ncbi:cupin [Shimia sp.]|uniref:cupin n=1 Tax=Shimia sp. TaxID=1954381 RepID=UPI0032994945